MVLKTYINSMIENIHHESLKNKNIKTDLVLDGGAFNGIFMLGSVLYLKELEKQNKIQIERISGCSIGALIGILYLVDKLDLALELCSIFIEHIKKYQNFKQSMKVIKKYLQSVITSDVSIFNNKFYLTYFNVNKGKQIIKKTYNSIDDLIECIIKSMYVPYLIDKNITDKDGCMDGWFPYMFKKQSGRNILFINLQGIDKIFKVLYMKNEKNIYPRLMEGINDIHDFLSTGQPNSLCSYVNEWGIIDIFYFRFRESIYTFMFFLFRMIIQLEYFVPKNVKNKNIIKKNAFILKCLWNDIIMYISS
jgi:hypothetical protein